MDWLKQHWFLLVALASVATAWGQQQVKVQTLEDAVKQQASVQEQVSELKAQTERVDERTKAITDNQLRQERMLEMLLQEQRKLTKTKPSE